MRSWASFTYLSSARSEIPTQSPTGGPSSASLLCGERSFAVCRSAVPQATKIRDVERYLLILAKLTSLPHFDSRTRSRCVRLLASAAASSLGSATLILDIRQSYTRSMSAEPQNPWTEPLPKAEASAGAEYLLGHPAGCTRHETVRYVDLRHVKLSHDEPDACACLVEPELSFVQLTWRMSLRLSS